MIRILWLPDQKQKSFAGVSKKKSRQAKGERKVMQNGVDKSKIYIQNQKFFRQRVKKSCFKRKSTVSQSKKYCCQLQITLNGS